ncbi:tyrosine-type recombinase/integrase [Marinifilum sp. N1E240]|uniref:site-specific integrase n=1 Tax=Marinifilum sp. N1E240 TaxID=2608082 RepID=UPI00128DC5F9|nr:site-specific integrase [Marinifilum sp. N1E240]MPQ48948.1 tyrosine-type recombinase/integrase [Marinifilum sp. N1E240]
MRQTTSILFFARKTTQLKNGESPIFVRITVDGQRLDISLKRSIDSNLWDANKGKCKGNSLKTKENNRYIQHMEQKLLKIITDLEIQEELTCKNLKASLNQENEDLSIISIFQRHNERCEKRIGIDMAEGTVERYRTCLKHTQDFIKTQYNLKDLPLTKINHQFITDFEHYFRTIRKCSTNTTFKYLKNFKKITNWALANEWMRSDPFTKIKFKMEKVDKEFLDDEELNKLMEKSFEIKRLEVIKDLYLFCCFTGLAFSDVKSLSQEHIVKGIDGNQWIKSKRRKTKVEFKIPLFDIPKAILAKYKDDPICMIHQKLLPVPSNQKMNAYLKEIADLCGINKNLSTHSARHTFATTVTLGNNLNIKAISKMMGHTNTRMTENYARAGEKLISNEMNKIQGKYQYV